jgi:hypothetical protein
MFHLNFYLIIDDNMNYSTIFSFDFFVHFYSAKYFTGAREHMRYYILGQQNS